MPMFDTPHSLKTYSRRKPAVVPSAKAFDDVIRSDRQSFIEADDAQGIAPEDGAESRKRKSRTENDHAESDSIFLFADSPSPKRQQKAEKTYSDGKTRKDISCFSSDDDDSGLVGKLSLGVKKKRDSSPNLFSGKNTFVDGDSRDEAVFEATRFSDGTAPTDQMSPEDQTALKGQTAPKGRMSPKDRTAPKVYKASKVKHVFVANSRLDGSAKSVVKSETTGGRVPKKIYGKEKVVDGTKSRDSLRRNSPKQSTFLESSAEESSTSGNRNSGKRENTFEDHGCFQNNSTSYENSQIGCNMAKFVDFTEIRLDGKKISSGDSQNSLCKNLVEMDAKAKTFVDKFSRMFGTKSPLVSKAAFKASIPTPKSHGTLIVSSGAVPDSNSYTFASSDAGFSPDFQSSVKNDGKIANNSNVSSVSKELSDPVSTGINNDAKTGIKMNSTLDNFRASSFSPDVSPICDKVGTPRRKSNGEMCGELFADRPPVFDSPILSKISVATDIGASRDDAKNTDVGEMDADDDCGSVWLLSPLPASPIESQPALSSAEKFCRRNLFGNSRSHSYNTRQSRGGSSKDEDDDHSKIEGSRSAERDANVHFEEHRDADAVKNTFDETLNESKVTDDISQTRSSRKTYSRLRDNSARKNVENSSELKVHEIDRLDQSVADQADIKIFSNGVQENSDPYNNPESEELRNVSTTNSAENPDQICIRDEISEIKCEDFNEKKSTTQRNTCRNITPPKQHFDVSKAAGDNIPDDSKKPRGIKETAKERSFKVSKAEDDNLICKRFRRRLSSSKIKDDLSVRTTGDRKERESLSDKDVCEKTRDLKSNSGAKRFKRRSLEKDSRVELSTKIILSDCASEKSKQDESLCSASESAAVRSSQRTIESFESPDLGCKTNAANNNLGGRSDAGKVPTSIRAMVVQSNSGERRLLKNVHQASKKAKAVYNPRQWHGSDKEENYDEACAKSQLVKTVSAVESYDFSTQDDSAPVLTRAATFPRRPQGNDIVKIRVAREDKPLFTVVHNVKEAHECQEYGETQEFHDDVDYILDGLQCSQPLATRCLSTLSLASKCSTPAFRMHLRAHGIIPKIFEALHDASDSMSLSLCLSAMLFTMSCDRLAVELDDLSLRLVLRLLDVNPDDEESSVGSSGCEDFERTRLKALDLCRAAVISSRTPYLELELPDITTQFLGLELLLSLASKLTADWFKTALRTLGGLAHVLDAVCECAEKLSSLPLDLAEVHLCLFSRVAKCLKVLDNVTYLCPENQSFLVDYNSSAFVIACDRLFAASVQHLTKLKSNPLNSAEKTAKDGSHSVLTTAVLSLLRVLLNVTHENEHGSRIVGQRNVLVTSVLTSVTNASEIFSPARQFDLSILGLSLLINLTEHCESNRQNLCNLKISNSLDSPDGGKVMTLRCLSNMFCQRYDAARVIEEAHDAKMEAAEKRQQTVAAARSSPLKTTSDSLNNTADDQSGRWVECESGLQWVEDESPSPSVRPADSDPDETPLSSQDDTDNYTGDLHTAGIHMEDSIVAAYIALLIGSVIQHQTHLAESFREYLPEFSFVPLVRMLRKFIGFMNFANVNSSGSSGSFRHILAILESL